MAGGFSPAAEQTIFAQEHLLNGFIQGMEEALAHGIVYKERLYGNGWEFMFGAPGAGETFPVLFHARFMN